MVEEHHFRFPDIFKALAFYRFCNPARARSQNLFEPERGQKPAGMSFSGDHPEDVYAQVVAAVTTATEGRRKDHCVAFEFYHMGQLRAFKNRSGGITFERERFGIDDIAKRFGRSKRQIRRWIQAIEDALEDELIRRELLPPKPEYLK